ncbi:MAG: hypothetical protein K1X94_33930, partial [Sandaracinaceae bacterium]|nr:hypothetical protein [Sandaracinaceae bacterium]
STPMVRLRAALEDVARESGVAWDGAAELGRPLFGEPVGAGSSAGSASVAWGSLDDAQRSSWVASVRPGAVLAQVFARERPGARGVLDRVLLLPARQRPLALEDVCTALFLEGVRAMRVIELEERRNVVVVIGLRAGAGPRGGP